MCIKLVSIKMEIFVKNAILYAKVELELEVVLNELTLLLRLGDHSIVRIFMCWSWKIAL